MGIWPGPRSRLKQAVTQGQDGDLLCCPYVPPAPGVLRMYEWVSESRSFQEGFHPKQQFGGFGGSSGRLRKVPVIYEKLIGLFRRFMTSFQAILRSLRWFHRTTWDCKLPLKLKKGFKVSEGVSLGVLKFQGVSGPVLHIRTKREPNINWTF